MCALNEVKGMMLYMKVIVVDDNKKKKTSNKEIEYRLNLFLEWLIYMFGYALVLLITSNLFRSLYVENFIYGFIAAVIIYILNKTIKPYLVTISLPLIGMSLGLFYFVINVVILLLVDLILGKHFYLTGFFSPIIVSIFISVMNVIMENLIIKPLIERCKK
jgi:putative membrane protein